MLISYNASVQAVYEIEINDGFDFEILKCENDFEIGDVTGYGQGFEIDSQHFDQGTTVNLNVTSFPIVSVQYNISAGSISELESHTYIGDYLAHLSYTEFPTVFLSSYYI